MVRETVHSKTFHPLRFPVYSHLVKVRPGSTMLYLAGVTGRDSKGQLVGKGDVKAQAKQAMENIKTVLAAEGATLKDVVQGMVFVTDIDQWVGPEIFKWKTTNYPDFWSTDGPAMTTVEVKKLASGCLIEIQVIAVKK